MGCRLLSAGANYAEQNLDTDNSGPDTAANVPGADTCLGGADLAPQNLGCILAAAAHISSDQVFKQRDPVSRDEEPIPPSLSFKACLKNFTQLVSRRKLHPWLL